MKGITTMNFTFENQGAVTYLVYTLSPEEEIDTMSLGMLTNNDISGLARTIFTQMDDRRYIKYNVSAKVSAKQFLFGPLNKKRLLGFFTGIANAIISAEDYMINENSILLMPDYIFSDVATCETVLICLPIEGININTVDPCRFFRDVMYTTQFDQTENCDYVAKIINYLNSSSSFSLTDFKALLVSMSESDKNFSSKEEVPNITPALQPNNSVPVKRPASEIRPNVPEPVPVQPSVPYPSPKAPQKHSQMAAPPSMDIPSSSKQPSAPAASVESDEKPMSILYLLQHYNKENANLYKAQKESKKAGRSAKINPAVKQPSPSFSKAQKNAPGFAIPGQNPSAPPFAVPEQNRSAPADFPVQKPAQSSAAPLISNTPRQPEPAQYAAQAYAPEPVRNDPSPAPVYAGTPVQTAVNAEKFNYDPDDGETVILGQESQERQITPHLIYKKNNQKIMINNSMFRIGRDAEFNDYVIPDNKYIGHSHCHIISRNGEYFIMDDNSKNHTYIDGMLITSGTEIKLVHGQNIRLANEEFEFRLF